jgi:hypothetical protein
MVIVLQIAIFSAIAPGQCSRKQEPRDDAG